MRPGRGCEKPSKKPLSLDPVTVDGVVQFKYQYDYCPVNYIDITHRSWLQLFGLFKKNLLLRSGAIEDQPAKYVDAMVFLDGLWNTHEREMLAQATSKKGAKRPTPMPKGRLR